jgi:hypothetical protein
VANISVSWTFPTSTQAVGEYAEYMNYQDRAPSYDSVNQATLLRQGGGGYQPTELQLLVGNIPASWQLVCVQILAKFASESTSVGASQASEPSNSLQPGATTEFAWYSVSPSSVISGNTARLANTSGSSTTGHFVSIKQIIWRFSTGLV